MDRRVQRGDQPVVQGSRPQAVDEFSHGRRGRAQVGGGTVDQVGPTLGVGAVTGRRELHTGPRKERPETVVQVIAQPQALVLAGENQPFAGALHGK